MNHVLFFVIEYILPYILLQIAIAEFIKKMKDSLYKKLYRKYIKSNKFFSFFYGETKWIFEYGNIALDWFDDDVCVCA